MLWMLIGGSVALASDCPASIGVCADPTPGRALPRSAACVGQVLSGGKTSPDCCVYRWPTGEADPGPYTSDGKYYVLAVSDLSAYTAAICRGDKAGLAGSVGIASPTSSSAPRNGGAPAGGNPGLVDCGCEFCSAVPAANCGACCAGTRSSGLPAGSVRVTGCKLCDTESTQGSTTPEARTTPGSRPGEGRGCIGLGTVIGNRTITEVLAEEGVPVMRHGLFRRRVVEADVLCTEPARGSRLCATETHFVMMADYGLQTMKALCEKRECWVEENATVINFWHSNRRHVISDGVVGVTMQTDNGLHRWFNTAERYVGHATMRAVWNVARIANL
jgi:hypothetical protein